MYFMKLNSFALMIIFASMSDAQTWSQLTSSGAPTARGGSAAIFDGYTQQMIVFGGQGTSDFNDTWALSPAGTGQWTQVSIAGGLPTARVLPTSVYDSINAKMIVFGGGLGSAAPCANDTWVLSNASGAGGARAWSQLNPSGGPPPARIGHSAVYDSAHNRMIVFGGDNCAASGTIFYNDVWVLTNANGLGGTPAWSQLSTTGTPPTARQGAAVTFDGTNLVVFGGNGSGGAMADVWVLRHANGVSGTPTWTQLAPSGTPPAARTGAAAVYENEFGRTIIVGGNSGGTFFADTWSLSPASGSSPWTWTQLSASGIPARTQAAAVYNAGTGNMIVFGGNAAGSTQLNDVWSLPIPENGVQRFPTGTPPSARAGAVAVLDSGFVSTQMILFGGQGASGVLNDVWSLGFTNRAAMGSGDSFRDASRRADPGHGGL